MNAPSTTYYTPAQIYALFQMQGRFTTPNVLSSAELNGKLPKALRMNLGKKVPRRCWKLEQLPEIGKRFGFLKPHPEKQKILSVFTQKGGTLKTSLTHALARILALHGIRVLAIGLDLQGSLTQILRPAPPETTSLEELMQHYKNLRGLYHFFTERGTPVHSLIQRTNLPTLDFIPETPSLAELILFLNQRTLKEFRFQEELIPHLKDYEVLLFDNGPSWNALVENSLACATTLLQPIGCDVGTFQVLDGNMNQLEAFRDQANLTWDQHLLLPTLKEMTKLSQQIYGAYLSQYPSSRLIHASIRKSVAGQEALYLNQSLLEYAPRSDLAQDYAQAIQEIWRRLNPKEEERNGSGR